MTQNNDSPAAGELAPSEQFVFNGIDGSTGGYLTPSFSLAELAEIAHGGKIEPFERRDMENKVRTARQMGYGTVDGVDANDLGQAGWAVVFPKVEAGSAEARAQAKIREALAPLLARRRAQASARGHEHYYREICGVDGYQRGETKQQFLARMGAGPGPANPDKMPYYLLLVGSPAEIPYRIQYQLDIQYAVGRIDFETVDEYARYARSVVEAETGQVVRARRAAFFGVCNPDDRSTQLSHAYLVKPLADFVEAKQRAGWSVERILAEDATHARLGDLYRDAPALMFTACHGMGFPSGHERQRDHQGALLCQDWSGPNSGRVERGHYFAGEDLDRTADLRGMIGMHFACFGMGTPQYDDFAARSSAGKERKSIAAADFTARLPQAMLANPGGGALAAIGHIDRAWGSSFLWIDSQGKRRTQRHLDVFESAAVALLDGKRVGCALEYFNVRYAELAADLSARIDEMQSFDEQYSDSELAQMWIFNNDARNYAVVGDPAVRLFESEAATGGAARGAQLSLRREVASTDASGGEAVDQGGAQPAGYAERDGAERDGAAPLSAQASLRQTEAVQSYGFFGGKDDAPGFLTRLGNTVAETLGQVISDAVSLEVKTYVSANMAQVARGKGSLPEAAGAELRAYTRCALDGDVDTCVPLKPDGEVDQALWSLHSELVAQAQSHRAQLVQALLSVLGPLSKG